MSGWLLPSLGHAVILALFFVRLVRCGAVLLELSADGKIALPPAGAAVLRMADFTLQYRWPIALIGIALIVGDAWVLRRFGGIKSVAGWRWVWRVGGVMLLVWVLLELTMMYTARTMFEKWLG